MSSSHTNIEVQEALAALGLYDGEIDGAIGTKSSAAIAKFQESKGLQVNGIPDPATLKALFPGPASTGPRTIQATITDYALNFLKSKTVWAAGALVAVLVGWVQTKFGFNVPPDVQATITTLIVSGFGLLIGVLQTAFNSPHMTTKQPAVVQKPAEFTK